MLFGLSEEIYSKIVAVFEDFPAIERAVIFGSRADDSYKKGSDIDLALFGNEIRFDTLVKLNSRLENLPCAYSFDLVDYNKISNPDLKIQIDKNGLLFYKKHEI